jgi:cell wall-associated NlpC family hydrolase
LQENIANKLAQLPQSLGQSTPAEVQANDATTVATTEPTESLEKVVATPTAWSPWLYLNVKPGDTLLVIFERNHLNLDDMYQILEVAEYADNLHSLYPNQEMRVKRGTDDSVEELFAALDLNTELHIFKNDAGFGGEIMQFNEHSGRMQVVTDPQILAEFGGDDVVIPKVQLTEAEVKSVTLPPAVTAKTTVKLSEQEIAKANKKDAKTATATKPAVTPKESKDHRKLAAQEAVKAARLKAIEETNAKKAARIIAAKEAVAKKEAAQKAARLAAAEEAAEKKRARRPATPTAVVEESQAKKAARIAAAEEAAARKAARLAAAEEIAARKAERIAAAEELAAARKAEQAAAAEEIAAQKAARVAEKQEQRRKLIASMREMESRTAAQERAESARPARAVIASVQPRAVKQEVNQAVATVRQSFTQLTPRPAAAIPSPAIAQSTRSTRNRKRTEVGTTVFDDVDSRYTTSSDPKLSKVVDSARGLLGTPYRFGGTTPKGFDCSGFVRYNAQKAGANLPRTAREQYSATKAVDKDDLKPGDLVFFNTRGRGVGHVGIYVGDNKFIHAPNRRKDVQVTSLNNKYYKQRYVRGGRF